MPAIYHVWAQVGVVDNATERRRAMAKVTWRREQLRYGQWHECPVLQSQLERSATQIGEAVPLPYIHDMLDLAFKASGPRDDILLITNADICLTRDLAPIIAGRCAHLGGATYCHRWDLPQGVMTDNMTSQHLYDKASWYVGSDLFAVTAQWWSEHAHELPPFVLGRECWDWAFRLLIGATGGLEIEKGIYHERHASDWEANTDLPGNLYNRGLMRQFLAARGFPLDFIKDKPFTPSTWPA